MQFSLSQIAKICGGTHFGADIVVSNFVTDSRSVVGGSESIFVAMQGINHDAHNYIGDMVERGFKAYLTEREVAVPSDCGVVVVKSALKALQSHAKFRRSQFSGCVAAITGSNGKTVVKEWINHSLTDQIKLYRSPRSYNSQLGVALSLLMMPDDAQVALIEAGISQRGEMQTLEQMIAPDVVIFTTLGDAHQSNFESLSEKLNEKLILATSAKTIIVNSAWPKITKAVRERFANREIIDASLLSVECGSDALTIGNAQLVKAFCSYVGCPSPDMSTLPPVAMRLEVKQGSDGALIVDDSYSCDTDSLIIALDYLGSVAEARRKVVVLTDILQSGMDDRALYALVAEQMKLRNVALFIGIGAKMCEYQHLFTTPSKFYATTELLLDELSTIDFKDSAVLIKGNRSARTERISHRLELHSHTTVLEVNLRAMERNINYFRSKMSPTTKMVAMVKASSYGAGEAEVANLLAKQGVDYLAVAFADEGAQLRAEGVTMPIVVLNADDQSFDIMVEHNLEPEIYSFRSLDAFVRAVEGQGRANYPIHIKLDTGMHRLGFMEADVPQLLERIDRYKGIVCIASLFTHLCVADDVEQDDFTRNQIALFDRLSYRIAGHCDYPVIRHAAASAAIVRFPEAHFDMCRLGLGMYGYGYIHNDSLEPVSSLRTRIVQIRRVEAGESVGYGRAGVVERASRIATIPIGYADGLDRHLGCGCWSMLVAGQKAPIVGRVCMDSCMIDVTDIEGVNEGDEVTVFSAVSGNTPEDMAEVLGTIPYEILTSVSKRVKRIYIYE